MIKRLVLTERETVELIKATAPGGLMLPLSFGPGWVALEWDTSRPMTWAVELIGRMRGVLNQGFDGEGI